MGIIEKILEHYGVMGMRWGVRKRRPSAPVSEDAMRAASAKALVKRGGVDALSNSDLRALNDRLQLEQQFSKLDTKDTRSRSFIENLIRNEGKTQMSRAAHLVATQKVNGLLNDKGILIPGVNDPKTLSKLAALKKDN